MRHQSQADVSVNRLITQLHSILLAPALGPTLEPSRHGITRAAQEDLVRRLLEDLTPREQTAFADALDAAGHTPLGHHGLSDPRVLPQFECAVLGELLAEKLTDDQYRTLALTWQVTASRPVVTMNADEAWLSSLEPLGEPGIESIRRPWGRVYVTRRRYGQVDYRVSTGAATPLLHFASHTFIDPRSGWQLPFAPVWSLWLGAGLLLWMEYPALGAWWTAVCLVGGALSVAAIASRLQHDLHFVEADGPLGRLLWLERRHQDAGILARLVADGWSWDQLDSWALVESVELAGQGRDGGLVAELLAVGWRFDHIEAAELIEVAGRVLVDARKADVPEVAIEVPGLVRSCESVEDMRAARDSLALLCGDLRRVAAIAGVHRAQADAPIVEARCADERDRRECMEDAAQARAAASLVSSREAVALLTEAHLAVMAETQDR